MRHIQRPALWSLGAVIVGLVLLPALGHGASHEPFFKGKTLRIVVGYSPGGGFDTYSRAIARHLGRHIPGNPTVIVENMPGAGGLIAANHIYKAAKPDGLTMGHYIGNLVLSQLLGQPGVEFDARKVEWVGAPSRDNVVCALTRASGITSLDRWMASKAPVKLGGTGRGTPTDDGVRILKFALGLPIHLVSGYKGTADIRLAAENGEVAGACWQWESIKVTWRKALDAGDVGIVLQVTPKAHPELAQVPVAITLAKSEEARQLIQLAIHDPSTITRPYSLPPATPKERVQALRAAFLATLRDPEFLADAKKSKLEIDAVSGEEVEKIVAGFFKVEPPIIARLKDTLLK